MKIILSVLFVLISTNQTYKLEGVVADSITGIAIENVTVELKTLKLKTKTDRLGRFFFQKIPKGNYQLQFSHADFEKKIERIRIVKSINHYQIMLQRKVDTNMAELQEPEEERLLGDMSDTNIDVSEIFQSSKPLIKEKAQFGSGMRMKRVSPHHYSFQVQQQNTEEYAYNEENRFFSAIDKPLSTFSIDVDAASYTNVRRFLKENKMPPKDAIRIEEFINYFSYDYQYPTDKPFSTVLEISDCPWNASNKLVHIGIQSKKPDRLELANSHLTFLIDVSGSMESPNKLPLLKKAFNLLINQLGENDNVSIVVYAGAAGSVLEAVPATNKQKIMAAINNLQAGGSTAGGQGIQLAYKIAERHFIENGNNRIILATDGDFNIGISNTNELQHLIENKRKSGVFLSVIGFGMGNYKDAKMEILANKGNGNYAYIDNLLEAKKVFVNEIGATLYTIAKDVKLQVEFNPKRVKSYRLLGYENRLLNDQDFNDDQKDAGELGAGHTVTALYEIVPATGEYHAEIPLKYQTVSLKEQSSEWLTVNIRYKDPNAEKSKLMTFVLKDDMKAIHATDNFRFSAAVAEFAMLLKESEFKGSSNYNHVLELARKSKGNDEFGYRAEFIQLVELTELIANNEL